MKRFLLILLGWSLGTGAHAELQPWEYTFNLVAQAAASPPKITINWPGRAVSQIVVRRKSPTDNAWGAPMTIPGNADFLTDANVEAGKVYEYEFIGSRQGNQVTTGYICTGAEIPAVERRGKVALIVDQTHAAALADELETLRKDLVGDGWAVVRRDVSPTLTPPQVKELIRAEYNADRANMRTVFLIGHVAVPYSGKINPDMHLDHLGAWPADVYYGEMDGAWTDQANLMTGAEYPWNDNVPGDGKFDQSTIPGAVELEVGRVDFFDMPAFAPRTERELLRNYLNKNHNFRHRVTQAPLRGLIRDNFGVIAGDAPAADAWRAYPALLGFFNYFENGPGQFFSTLQNEAYLFAFACGGGDFTKEDGAGSTTDFVNGDPKAAFYLLHGSYFGDWNTKNNFLRAAIATPTLGLVSIWTSLPHWYFHHLALGETFGYATRLTQNNQNGLYRNSTDLSIGQVHISMMGDPTLRPFPLAPPSNLQLSATDKLTLSWNDAPQAIKGYNVYVGASSEGPFVKQNQGIITGTSYEMSIPSAGRYFYMVKSEALQTTGSGSFNNLSQGIFIQFDSDQPPPVLPDVSVAATDATGNENGDPMVFTFTRTSPISAALNVAVQFSGTATLGQDYSAGATVSFAAGSSLATLTISPVQDSINEIDETVTVMIVGGAGYRVGSAPSASGTIQGSGESRIGVANLSASGAFGFNATGFANRAYRIESRTPEGAWRIRANAVAGSDGALSYRESAAPEGGGEFYRIVWE